MALIARPCCQQYLDDYGQPVVIVKQLVGGPAPTTTIFAEERAVLHELFADACTCYYGDVMMQHCMLRDGAYSNPNHTYVLCISELSTLSLEELDSLGGFADIQLV